MKYNGIAQQISQNLSSISGQQMKAVNKALVDSAIEMRDRGRIQFESNTYGYKLKSIADGVMIGRFKKNYKQSYITIHAMGNKTNKKSWKARIFAGGAYHRYTKKSRYRGHIEDLNTIESVLDQRILDDNILKAIK